jgi:2-polyprenyl-3-methyl-5-hydroxy-6-metoxy-1,4-benzoquinol methylase
MASRLEIKVRLLSPVRCGRLYDAVRTELTAGEIGALRNLLQPGKVYWEQELVDTQKCGFICCAVLRNLFYISPIGDVQPCCYLPVVFGNIRKESLLDIIRRMWGADLLRPGTVHDCPTNTKAFQDSYGAQLARTGGAPVVYEVRFSPNREEEWDDWAASYGDTVDRLAGIQDDEIMTIVDFAGKRTLDLGCGTGRLARRLAPIADKITVVDFSPKILEKTRENLRGFVNTDIRLLDIANGSASQEKYDIITATLVMCHILNPGSVVENMKNSLVPGGEILIVDHLQKINISGIFKFYAAAVSRLGWMSCAALYCRNSLPASRMAKHIRGETQFDIGGFRERYENLFPGAEIGIKAGIFAYLKWKKPGSPVPAPGMMSGHKGG